MVRAAPSDDLDNCGLSYSQLEELWLGCPHDGSNFATTEELLDAWVRGREVVMRLWGSGGRRPQGWWQLDPEARMLEYPGYSRERSYLWRAGVLSEQERGAAEAEWRAAYDAVKGKSARERREAFEHYDIPRELTRRWSS